MHLQPCCILVSRARVAAALGRSRPLTSDCKTARLPSALHCIACELQTTRFDGGCEPRQSLTASSSAREAAGLLIFAAPNQADSSKEHVFRRRVLITNERARLQSARRAGRCRDENGDTPARAKRLRRTAPSRRLCLRRFERHSSETKDVEGEAEKEEDEAEKATRRIHWPGAVNGQENARTSGGKDKRSGARQTFSARIWFASLRIATWLRSVTDTKRGIGELELKSSSPRACKDANMQRRSMERAAQ